MLHSGRVLHSRPSLHSCRVVQISAVGVPSCAGHSPHSSAFLRPVPLSLPHLLRPLSSPAAASLTTLSAPSLLLPPPCCRVKFAEATVRRKGQVQEVRASEPAYGGEATGIKSRLSKSVRL